MSKIAEFIQNQVFLPRLQRTGVLTVYDPAGRYRDICLAMAGPAVQVVDAGTGSLCSREAAMKALLELGRPGTTLTGLILYIPAGAPQNDEDRQKDPFAVYALCGGLFPDGDGDELLNLCLKAKPDQATEIRRIFQESAPPAFSVIDAVGSGTGWPILQSLLEVESARDILLTLLAPDEKQKGNLNGQDTWVSEAKTLFSSCLGLKLITRGRTWSSIAEELFRFVLFSEFVFDLPGPLPETLNQVPHAGAEARPLVEDLCERLRSDRRTQSYYIDRAEAIEHDLHMVSACEGISDFGTRDTFAFEERSFLDKAAKALAQEDHDTARSIHYRHAHTVWLGKGESQARWAIVQAALLCQESCEDGERELARRSGSMKELVAFYLDSLREADRRHRELEQTLGVDGETLAVLEEVTDRARERYRHLMAKVQDIFLRHLEKDGWPAGDFLSNGDVFDKLVSPRLQQSGHKVAYILVDALRYELGAALERLLHEDGQVELKAACALLPSTTAVGMAGLLPEAGKRLRICREGSGIVPMLGEDRLSGVPQRMEVFRKAYGDRFREMTLADFLQSRKGLPDVVDLLVLRSTEIDTHLESSPETTLNLIQDTLKRIRRGIRRLKEIGFQEAIIATDHGFHLHTQPEAGDTGIKPNGNWIILHDRFLLGDGTGDAANFVLPAATLGIRGDFAQAAGPRSLTAYREGLTYFHGGASLQECMVPVLCIWLVGESLVESKPIVEVRYKSGQRKITTRLPVISVKILADLFPEGSDVELLLEARDKKNRVVGEAKPGGPVSPLTGTILLKRGEQQQITLRMAEEFEGKFTVLALDPKTSSSYCKLELETDYTV